MIDMHALIMRYGTYASMQRKLVESKLVLRSMCELDTPDVVFDAVLAEAQRLVADTQYINRMAKSRRVTPERIWDDYRQALLDGYYSADRCFSESSDRAKRRCDDIVEYCRHLKVIARQERRESWARDDYGEWGDPPIVADDPLRMSSREIQRRLPK